MRRLTTILLLLFITARGTGTLQFLHLLEHDHHAAHVLRAVELFPTDCDDDEHDESTCAVCSDLHMPVTADGSPSTLVSLGLIVTFMNQIPPRLDAQRVPASIDCRGPPA